MKITVYISAAAVIAVIGIGSLTGGLHRHPAILSAGTSAVGLAETSEAESPAAERELMPIAAAMLDETAELADSLETEQPVSDAAVNFLTEQPVSDTTASETQPGIPSAGMAHGSTPLNLTAGEQEFHGFPVREDECLAVRIGDEETFYDCEGNVLGQITGLADVNGIWDDQARVIPKNRPIAVSVDPNSSEWVSDDGSLPNTRMPAYEPRYGIYLPGEGRWLMEPEGTDALQVLSDSLITEADGITRSMFMEENHLMRPDGTVIATAIRSDEGIYREGRFTVEESFIYEAGGRNVFSSEGELLFTTEGQILDVLPDGRILCIADGEVSCRSSSGEEIWKQPAPDGFCGIQSTGSLLLWRMRSGNCLITDTEGSRLTDWETIRSENSMAFSEMPEDYWPIFFSAETTEGGAGLLLDCNYRPTGQSKYLQEYILLDKDFQAAETFRTEGTDWLVLHYGQYFVWQEHGERMLLRDLLSGEIRELEVPFLAAPDYVLNDHGLWLVQWKDREDGQDGLYDSRGFFSYYGKGNTALQSAPGYAHFEQLTDDLSILYYWEDLPQPETEEKELSARRLFLDSDGSPFNPYAACGTLYADGRMFVFEDNGGFSVRESLTVPEQQEISRQVFGQMSRAEQLEITCLPEEGEVSCAVIGESQRSFYFLADGYIGRAVYRVEYPSSKSPILGNVIRFADMESGEIIGYNYRD